ncbi:MAG TPA: hypothetical protein PK431_04200 [Chitinophagales bacterium]|nr:hypothetical protein [Chitinophagales bacterium]
MSQNFKQKICLLLVIIPILILLVSTINSELFFLFPLSLIILLPFTVLAIIIKKIWKIKFEDGSTQGDIKLLLFGTLAFIGILGGILSWMFLFVVTS